jgi:glucokinase
MELLGLDLGATCVRGVVVDGDGRVVRSTRHEGPSSETIPRAWRALRRETEFAAIGVATEGELTWDPAALPATVPIHHCSLGPSAVAAEAWVGAARGTRHAICLWIGDRVFAGTLVDGQPLIGVHGLAGAAAWLAINPVERQDYRQYGSLAAEVSERGIARRLAWRVQAGDQSAVIGLAGDLDTITATNVFDGARAGDGVAISVVRDTARYVGMAVANLVAAIDPEIVVLGGAIAAAGDLLLEPVRLECLRRLPPAMGSSLRFEISPLADDGIAIGAASLALAARRS